MCDFDPMRPSPFALRSAVVTVRFVWAKVGVKARQCYPLHSVIEVMVSVSLNWKYCKR